MSTELVRCDYCGSVVSPEEEKPRNRIAALESEVAELRRDRDMLDFLEQRGSLAGIGWFATETLREALMRLRASQAKALLELEAAQTAEEDRAR